MAASRVNLDSPRVLAGTAPAPLPGDDAQLAEALKYCAPSTYEAARLFRKTSRPEYLPAIFHGVLMHYVEPDRRDRLRSPADSLRLREDLGLDSLTLMEIVIRLEDVLQISIRDDELRQFRTVGEVRNLIEQTLATGSSASTSPVCSRP